MPHNNHPNGDHAAFLVAKARELSDILLTCNNGDSTAVVTDLPLITTIVLAANVRNPVLLSSLGDTFSGLLREKVVSLQNFVLNQRN